MLNLKEASFKALTFDCYGTLIDWERGILSVLRGWADRHALKVTDEQLLEAFSQAERRLQAEDPTALYPDVLRAVHGQIAARFGVPGTPDDAEALATSVGDWPAFDDSPAALRALKERYRLLILSNVDRASFALSNERLEVEFDEVITAEDVGTYKPDPTHFLLAFEVLEEMGIGRGQILHVAQSLFHDHAPAKALGLKTVWVDRRRGRKGTGATPRPPGAVEPDLVVTSLAELAQLV